MNQFKKAKQKALESGHHVENIGDLNTAGVKEPIKEEKVEQPVEQNPAAKETHQADSTSKVEDAKPIHVEPTIEVIQPANTNPAVEATEPVNVNPTFETVQTVNATHAAEAIHPVNIPPAAETVQAATINPAIETVQPLNTSPVTEAIQPVNTKPVVETVPPVNINPVVEAIQQDKVIPQPEAVKQEYHEQPITAPVAEPVIEHTIPSVETVVHTPVTQITEPIPAPAYNPPEPEYTEQVAVRRNSTGSRKSIPNIFSPKGEAKSMRKSLVLKPTSVKIAENYCAKNGGSFNELIQTLLDNFIDEYGL